MSHFETLPRPSTPVSILIKDVGPVSHFVALLLDVQISMRLVYLVLFGSLVTLSQSGADTIEGEMANRGNRVTLAAEHCARNFYRLQKAALEFALKYGYQDAADRISQLELSNCRSTVAHSHAHHNNRNASSETGGGSGGDSSYQSASAESGAEAVN